MNADAICFFVRVLDPVLVAALLIVLLAIGLRLLIVGATPIAARLAAKSAVSAAKSAGYFGSSLDYVVGNRYRNNTTAAIGTANPTMAANT